MRAVDTNVLARLVLADDEDQYRQAAALLDTPLWVTTTVWLELGWLLGKRLGLDRATISDALVALLSIDSIQTPDREGMRWAIDRYRAGADWEDVMHLVTARGPADSFATFDRGISRRSGDTPPLPIETLG